MPGSLTSTVTKIGSSQASGVANGADNSFIEYGDLLLVLPGAGRIGLSLNPVRIGIPGLAGPAVQLEFVHLTLVNDHSIVGGKVGRNSQG